MKKLLFVLLFFGGLFGGNAQTNWETDGNDTPCNQQGGCLINGGYAIGTKEPSCGFGSTPCPSFNIIHAGEIMTRFVQDLIILAPNTATKVLIGDQFTTTPGNYKLYVEEGILTERVKVALNGSPDWADYVFKDGYELMSLYELEAFINKYGHLPNIPSAEELVENGGIDLGKMQAAQMAKIEELTLHLIQKDKAIKALQKQVETLSRQMELLLEQH